jgi:hypothetical protein
MAKLQKQRGEGRAGRRVTKGQIRQSVSSTRGKSFAAHRARRPIFLIRVKNLEGLARMTRRRHCIHSTGYSSGMEAEGPKPVHKFGSRRPAYHAQRLGPLAAYGCPCGELFAFKFSPVAQHHECHLPAFAAQNRPINRSKLPAFRAIGAFSA